MLLDRDNEKKNRGKATKLLPDDICDKLKDLDLKSSEPSEGKLNVSLKHNTFSQGMLKENLSKMKDLQKNNFGDDIIKIGDQLRNVRITEKEYNCPPKNPEIVLNILSDNKIEDNNNCKIDCNIHVEEELQSSDERKAQKTDVFKEEKVNTKHEEEEKTSDKEGCDSQKTEENVDILSRSPGPVTQKLCHQPRQPYDTCSRGHHSGGRVRVTEQPSQTTVNGYQPWTVNSQLNIIPNEQGFYPPSMETPYLHMAGAQTANINTTSLHEPAFDVDEGDMSLEKILKDHPYIYNLCKALSSPTCNNPLAMTGGDIKKKNVEEILLPSSPDDSGTSSVGSPAGSYQPPSVQEHDSGLDSPLHGVEYLQETPYDNDLGDHQKRPVIQDWSEMWKITNEGPDTQGGQDKPKRSDMQNGQVMQQGLFPQSTQSRPFPGVGTFPQENHNEQFQQEIPDVPGQQNIQKPNIHGHQITQKPNIQGRQIIPEKNMCCKLSIGLEKTQVGQIIHEEYQCGQITGKRSDMQGGPNLQDSPYSPSRDIVPQICGLGKSPTKSQGTKYRPILPKPELFSAKARFQQLLDKDRRYLAWLKVNEKLIADPKRLETQDAEGDTDLMIACCNKFESHLEMIYAMVESLRRKPDSLIIRNKQGHSALYLACEVLNDVPEVAAYIAEALIEQKIDVANMTYDGGLTLIQILEKKGDTHKKVLEGLLALKDSSGRNVFQSGGDVNANNFRDFNESILLLG